MEIRDGGVSELGPCVQAIERDRKTERDKTFEISISYTSTAVLLPVFIKTNKRVKKKRERVRSGILNSLGCSCVQRVVFFSLSLSLHMKYFGKGVGVCVQDYFVRGDSFSTRSAVRFRFQSRLV